MFSDASFAIFTSHTSLSGSQDRIMVRFNPVKYTIA